jgi:vacuolar-type H+-ATPase subunit I/STV1
MDWASDSLTSRKPVFGWLAPILTCVLWCSVIAGWIWFWLVTPAHPNSLPDAKDYINLAGFFGMMLGTVVLFVAGLIILAAAAMIYAVRSRRYRLEQEARCKPARSTVPSLVKVLGHLLDCYEQSSLPTLRERLPPMAATM